MRFINSSILFVHLFERRPQRTDDVFGTEQVRLTITIEYSNERICQEDS